MHDTESSFHIIDLWLHSFDGFHLSSNFNEWLSIGEQGWTASKLMTFHAEHKLFLLNRAPDSKRILGKIIAEGTPEKISAVKESYTGKFIREIIGNGSMKKTA